jgi:hypothetical protein
MTVALLGVAAIPWLLVCGLYLGAVGSIAVVALVEVLCVYAALFLTAATGLPMEATVIALALAGGVIGVVLGVRARARFRLPSRAALSVLLPSLAGGLLWLSTMLLALVVPGASRVSWAMLGDSANNILFARELLGANGVVLPAIANPVPLPAGIVAIAMDLSRGSVASDDLARHDVASLASVWSLLIVLGCVTCGLLAGSIVRSAGASTAVIAGVSAGASLIPLSWFVTGYSIEFGFFNASVVLPILLAALLAYVELQRRPAVCLAVLSVAATLVVAVWSPLVVVPLAVGLAVVLTRFRELLATRGRALVVLGVGVLQFLVYGILVVVPGIAGNSTALAAQGGVYPFREWVFAAIAVALLAAAALAFPSVRHPSFVVAVTVVVAAGLALAVLLRVAPQPVGSWSYYPMKFAWLAAVLAIVLIVGYAAAAVVRLARSGLVRGTGFGLVAVLTALGVVFAPGIQFDRVQREPLSSVLAGRYFGGDAVAEQVFASATPGQARILWHSDDQAEARVNFWTLLLWSESVADGKALRVAAYGNYDHDDPAELCRIMELMGGDVAVTTADTSLPATIDGVCPELHAEVSVVTA